MYNNLNILNETGLIVKKNYNYKTNNHSFLIIDKANVKINGCCTDKNFKSSLLKSMGEYYERKAVFNNLKNMLLNKSFKVINLIDNKIINYKINDSNIRYFYDTNGAACHITSKNALNNSLFEFVERQSFIFSYLSKTCKYKLENIDSENEQRNNVNFYEISLIEAIKVVFALGEYRGKCLIGLGADYDINKAIKKAAKEMSQCMFAYDSENIEIKLNDEEIDYGDIFYSLDPKRIFKAYDYLGKSFEISIDSFNDFGNFGESILELNRKFKMNPKLVRLESNNKVLKIFEPKWFPTICPLDYDEVTLKYIENITNSRLERSCNFIPFP